MNTIVTHKLLMTQIHSAHHEICDKWDNQSPHLNQNLTKLKTSKTVVYISKPNQLQYELKPPEF